MKIIRQLNSIKDELIYLAEKGEYLDDIQSILLEEYNIEVTEIYLRQWLNKNTKYGIRKNPENRKYKNEETIGKRLSRIKEDILFMEENKVGSGEILRNLKYHYDIELSDITLREWFKGEFNRNIQRKQTHQDILWDLEEDMVRWIFEEKLTADKVLDNLYFKYDLFYCKEEIYEWRDSYLKYNNIEGYT